MAPVSRHAPPLRPYALGDRYELEDGRIFLSGMQGLVRGLFDQRRSDRRLERRTAMFVSGYQGSPLSGFDRELARQGPLLEALDVVHRPGLNEELAATSVWGTQSVGRVADPRYDGVVGVWYGKAPGLDRASDAVRHANYAGTHPLGGVVAFVGDDPASKSSTVPTSMEPALASLMMPTFAPGDVGEVVELTQHAIACSRISGAWSALKIAATVADGTGTADIAADRVVPVAPVREWHGRPYRHVPRPDLTVPVTLEAERTLFEVRLPLAADYATLNGVNRVARSGPDDWIGIVAAGKTYFEVVQALEDLGLDDAALDRAGVRLLKLGMVFPLDEALVRDFARGLEEIVVVEDKLPFLETRVRDVLYGITGAPRVLGKRDERGEALLSPASTLESDAIARALERRLAPRVEIARPLTAPRPSTALPVLPVQRTPFFCSGCPHNSSTIVPEGSAVGAGIGCHAMVLLAPHGRGEISGLTQMGGEGAQWLGIEPFTGTDHFVQNLGDGTFHHSGSLAIRAAVAAGAHITYKLLYNEAVAMTGGQEVEGRMSVPALTHWLRLEGVARTIVTTDDPGKYRGVELAAGVEVRDRERLIESQEELARIPGVTVLIHDQQCAAEKRRLRKRGRLPEPAQRVFINERVCEGCGDCGAKSSCLSVQPVDTEFGRKTRIHQASCNKDYSCLDGDCPSFLTVIPARRAERHAPDVPIELPEPAALVPEDDFLLRMPGIGGTGVVTLSQTLGVAALLDGRHVSALDQTGLAQKGGPVVSDLRVTTRPVDGANHARAGRLDLLLGLDLLGASSAENLAMADPERTVAVVSTGAVPTGEMVVDTGARFPELSTALDAIEERTRPDGRFFLDAHSLSEALFDDHMPTNMLVLGAAYQMGAVPIGRAAIERAIELNGGAVRTNLLAFAWGRAVVVDPDLIERVVLPAEPPEQPAPAAARPLLEGLPEGRLGELLERRVVELVRYQDAAYAREYLDFVEEVRRREAEAVPGRTDVAVAVARHLYKLMAYKDEYEVARLHLDAAERARVTAAFGEGAKVRFHLHPPLLRALGMRRKLRLGPWFAVAFRMLYAARRLRGTPLDVFGHARVRRVERALVGEYRDAVGAALARLAPATHADVEAICSLPDRVRGYEEIKLGNVAEYRALLEAGLRDLGAEVPRVSATAEVVWDGVKHSYVSADDWRDRISSALPLFTETDPDLDPVTYQVLRNRLFSINLAHGETITRVSGSPVMQALDFNMTILTELGEAVMNAPFLQYLNAGAPLGVRYIMERFSDWPGIEEGDVYLVNDPWIAAIHQNDVLLAAPVFVDGRLFAWVSNAGHQIDLGGIVPGGWPQNAPDVFSDPAIFRPIKIVERGRLRPDVEETYRRQSRFPDLVALDFRAQLAGCNYSAREIAKVCEEFGAPTVRAAMRRILDDGQRSVAEKLSRLPDGTWSEVRYVDEAMPGDRGTYRMQVNVTKVGDRLIVDNEGTDEQRTGPIGLTYVAFVGSVLAVLGITMLTEHLFSVGGAERQVEFRPRPGLLTCVDHPAETAGGIVSILTQINALHNIVGRMLACDPEQKEHIVGAGPEWPLLVLEARRDDGEHMAAGITDAAAMGTPARSFGDGVHSGGPTWCPLMRLLDVESMESFFPMLYLYRRMRPDSGGIGRWAGGTGMDYAFVPHRAGQLDAITNFGGMGASTNNGLGLFGGLPAPTAHMRCARGTDLRERFARRELPGHVDELAHDELLYLRAKSNGTAIGEADVMEGAFTGGAGYGDPLDREPWRVAADVRAGYVTAATAERIYAVALGAGGEVDDEATERLRAAERERRAAWRPVREAFALDGDEPSTPADGAPPRAVHEHVVDRDEEGRRVLACARCDTVLADHGGNYKHGLLVDEGPITFVPTVRDPGHLLDPEVVLRRYCCPGCRVQMATEILLAGELPVAEMVLR